MDSPPWRGLLWIPHKQLKDLLSPRAQLSSSGTHKHDFLSLAQQVLPLFLRSVKGGLFPFPSQQHSYSLQLAEQASLFAMQWHRHRNVIPYSRPQRVNELPLSCIALLSYMGTPSLLGWAPRRRKSFSCPRQSWQIHGLVFSDTASITTLKQTLLTSWGQKAQLGFQGENAVSWRGERGRRGKERQQSENSRSQNPSIPWHRFHGHFSHYRHTRLNSIILLVTINTIPATNCSLMPHHEAT